jgi:hypothetical protein
MKWLHRLIALIVLSSAGMAAQCQPGDESGRIYKVADQEVSSQASGGPQLPSNAAPNSTVLSLRTAIFFFGNKRYSLFVRSSDSREVNLSAGQTVCLRKEGGVTHIVTEQGRVLPGVPRPLPTLPANKKPGVSARPDQDK